MEPEGLANRDSRDLPNYTPAEAAGWLGESKGRLTYWLKGWGPNSRYSVSVIEPAQRKPLTLSFNNLVECSILAAIREDFGISLQKTRKALEYLSQVGERLGTARPLLSAKFASDGIHLFVEHFGALIAASHAGQVHLRAMLEASLRRIERDSAGMAIRLYLWSHSPEEPRIVSVDPRFAFGRPVLIDTSIPAEAIVERFRSGERIVDLAQDYRVQSQQVEALLRWALAPTAA